MSIESKYWVDVPSAGICKVPENFNPTSTLKDVTYLCSPIPEGFDEWQWTECALIATQDGTVAASENDVYKVYISCGSVNSIKVEDKIQPVKAPAVKEKVTVISEIPDADKIVLDTLSGMFDTLISVRSSWIKDANWENVSERLCKAFLGYEVGLFLKAVKNPFGVRFNLNGNILTMCVWQEGIDYHFSIYDKSGKRIVYKTRNIIKL